MSLGHFKFNLTLKSKGFFEIATGTEVYYYYLAGSTTGYVAFLHHDQS